MLENLLLLYREVGRNGVLLEVTLGSPGSCRSLVHQSHAEAHVLVEEGALFDKVVLVQGCGREAVTANIVSAIARMAKAVLVYDSSDNVFVTVVSRDPDYRVSSVYRPDHFGVSAPEGLGRQARPEELFGRWGLC